MPVSFSFFYQLKKERADILHFHLPNPLAVMAYLIVQPKGKVIVTWHSDIVRQKLFSKLFHPFLIWFLSKTDTIIATSPNLIDSSYYLRKYREKTVVIPLGIHVNDYQLTPAIQTRIATIQSHHKNQGFALFVGRFVYYKGVMDLLEAAKGTSIPLVMIGKGPFEKQIRTFCQKNAIEAQVTILPPQPFETLLAYFYACTFFVLPSICNSEAFGIVQLEAMVCKKPVISTNLPTGVPYVNQDHVTGLIVPPQNPAELRKAMQTLYHDSTLQDKLKKQAYQRVIETFQVEPMIEKINQLYLNATQINIISIKK